MTYDRLQNPQDYRQVPEPKFDIDTFQDLVYNESGKGFPATIHYEYFYYESAVHITKLTVSTGLRHVEEEDIINLLHFREGKRIELETKLVLL